MNQTHTDTLTIKEANEGCKQILNDFIMLPYRLYKGDPHWVPPLISEEKRFLSTRYNPFLQRNPVVLYVCYRGKTPVGRIAGIINKEHNQFHNDRAAFFGFFDAIDDDGVAVCLFEAVSAWVKERGATVLRGPTNFTLNDISGLLIDGFSESPFIMMPYNPAYYQELYRKNGFETVMRYYAYSVTDDTIRFPRYLEKLENRLEESEIQIRNLDFKYLERDFGIMVEIFNEAWSENWGFVPLTFQEALEDFRKIKIFAQSDLLFIAEYKGEPAGFAIALPDINQALKPLKGRLFPFNWIRLFYRIRKINRIRVVLMGVLKKHRSKGIDLMFYKKIVENAVRHNYHRAELSWILENNSMMNRVLTHINSRRNKVYAIFEKSLIS